VAEGCKRNRGLDNLEVAQPSVFITCMAQQIFPLYVLGRKHIVFIPSKSLFHDLLTK
jgi:hypothetical protein